MDELIEQAIRLALEEKVVAKQALDGNGVLLAYPLESGALIAIGCEAAEVHVGQIEALLSRRGEDLERFGCWLPAMLRDGSVYVVRRLSKSEVEGATLRADELLDAQELLA